jgi:hypothetical protein
MFHVVSTSPAAFRDREKHSPKEIKAFDGRTPDSEGEVKTPLILTVSQEANIHLFTAETLPVRGAIHQGRHSRFGGDTNRYHQAVAVLAGAPYIFQFSCPRSGSPTLLNASYEKMIAPLISGTAPTSTTAANVSSSSRFSSRSCLIVS